MKFIFNDTVEISLNSAKNSIKAVSLKSKNGIEFI